jgi:hypothetical protein
MVLNLLQFSSVSSVFLMSHYNSCSFSNNPTVTGSGEFITQLIRK